MLSPSSTSIRGLDALHTYNKKQKIATLREFARRGSTDYTNATRRGALNVTLLIVAEFDVDKGSTIRHQFPKPMSVSEEYLAEMMLPEGSHLFETDWTVCFFSRSEVEGEIENNEQDQQNQNKGQQLQAAELKSNLRLDYEQKRKETLSSSKLKKEALSFHCEVHCHSFDEKIQDWVFTPSKGNGGSNNNGQKLDAETTSEQTYIVSFAIVKSSSHQSKKKKQQQQQKNNDINSTTTILYEMVVSNNDDILFRVPIGDHMRFTVEKDSFLVIYKPDGNSIGLRFKTLEDLKEAEQIMERIRKASIIARNEALEKKTQETLDQVRRLDDLFCCLNLVTTKVDASASRGARTFAIALVTQHRFFHIYKPLLLLAIDEYLQKPSTEILSYLFDTINHMDLSAIPLLSQLDRRVIRASRLRLFTSNTTKQSSLITTSSSMTQQCEFSSYVKWHNAKIPVRVPLMMEEEEVGGISLVGLIRTFGHDIMIIYNAVLNEKRVLFLGHQQHAYDVCNYVLSACLLVCPPLKGHLRRCFPYVSLTNIDFIDVPGYIAGVTNPIFQQHMEWWDICCDLTSGEVQHSRTYLDELNVAADAIAVNQNEIPYKTQSYFDSNMISYVLSGIEMLYGEEWTRCQFRDYTQHLVDIAYGNEVFQDDNTRTEELAANSFRINHWKRSLSYLHYDAERQVRQELSAFSSNDSLIKQHVRKLQVSNVSTKELIIIFEDFLKYINNRQEKLEFMTFLPDSQNGLFPIAINMLSESPKVRQCTVELLSRLDEIPEGKKCVEALNYFLLIVYFRYIRSISTSSSDSQLSHVHSLHKSECINEEEEDR